MPPQPFDRFIFFPNLPIELGLAIRKLSMAEERIEIHFSEKDNRYFTDSTLPTTLHTCEKR
jgi:hypothetical protein